MQITNPTQDDARLCAQLLKMLAAGSWTIEGTEIKSAYATLAWVSNLSNQIASAMSAPAAPTPAAPIKKAKK